MPTKDTAAIASRRQECWESVFVKTATAEKHQTTLEHLEEVCARNTMAEMHFEDQDGKLSTSHMRLLRVEDDELHVDMPNCIGKDLLFRPRLKIVVYFAEGEKQFGFKSEVIRSITKVDLNSEKQVVGMTLVVPSQIPEQQRRRDFRLSLSRQNFSVDFHRTDEDEPHHAPLDADRFAGRITNLSGGGLCVSIDVTPQARFTLWERLYVLFNLPELEERFVFPVEVRHFRRIHDDQTLLVGVQFADCEEHANKLAIRRIRQFVVDEERRQLRPKG